MAVHVVLDREQMRSILSLYHLDDLEDFGGIRSGAVNTAYWVAVSGQKFFLRITENKRVDDMIYEKELLLHLSQDGLSVPELVKNVASGTFTPWTARGRYVSLFQYLPGRELAVFELRPRHARAIGLFIARMHKALETFKRKRTNTFSLAELHKRHQRLQRAVEKRRLPKRMAPDIERLGQELKRHDGRSFESLPRGTVHGDLFVENTRFANNRLVGVFDFEMACTERWIWDLAVAVNDWCWRPSPEQQGGPAGSFDLARSRSLLRAYHSKRPLSEVEQLALAEDLRLAAARFAITRILDFDLKKVPKERRAYKDYRHYMARLDALSGNAAEELIRSSLKS